MIWTMMKPFISAKFGRKLLYVNQLAELSEFIWLNQIPIPIEVQNFDETKLKAGLKVDYFLIIIQDS